MGTLEITVERGGGTRTVYRGAAAWASDGARMELAEGPALEGYDHGAETGLEFHAALCRAAAWKAGFETSETWGGEFLGGRVR